jgi:hypothetical protein
MSLLMRQALNALANEAQRVRDAAEGFGLAAIPALTDVVALQAGPSRRAIIDAVNTVLDPMGYGNTDWSAAGGGISVDEVDVPPGWTRARVAIGTGGTAPSLDVRFTPVAGDNFWYALVKTAALAVDASVQLQRVSDGVAMSDVTIPAGVGLTGWTLVGATATLAGVPYRLRLKANANVGAGTRLAMTGATVVQGVEPAEPFSGASPQTRNFTYGWRGAAHGSPSLRYTTQLDALSLWELEHQLGPEPTGWNREQRRDYLMRRFEARGKPWSSKYVELLVAVAQSDLPDFPDDGVRVLEDHPSYAFTVSISYPPDGKMRPRLEQLAYDLSPAHLKLTSVSFGTGFRAGISQAGDTIG